MKIRAKLCLTKQPAIVAISCPKTGINSAIALPEIPGKVLEVIHPLAYWSNVKGILAEGTTYFRKLDSNVLAGLVLCTYEHFSLLDKYELTAQEANSILMTASDDTLIDALAIARQFTEKNTVGIAALSLEWKEIKDRDSIDRQIAEYVKGLKAEFFVSEEQKKQDRITVHNQQVVNRRLSSGVIALEKPTLSDCEKEWEEGFKANRKEAKSLVEALKLEGIQPPHLTNAFMEFLGKCLPGRLLVIMNQKTRADVCKRLRDSGRNTAAKLADVIEACHNPYDIFSRVDDSLDRASDAFYKAEKPKTIKEILAEKLRAKNSQVIAHTVEEVEALFDAQAEGHHVTKPHQDQDLEDTEEEGLEEVDQMMARTKDGIYGSEDF